jgi:hypothetical protein
VLRMASGSDIFSVLCVCVPRNAVEFGESNRASRTVAASGVFGPAYRRRVTLSRVLWNAAGEDNQPWEGREGEVGTTGELRSYPAGTGSS